MDSLLANYCSSSEDERDEEPNKELREPAAPPPPPPKTSSFSNRSIFSTLPSPNKSPSISSIFSSLPPPKSKESTNLLGLDLNPKKIVPFTPQINPSLQKRSFLDRDDEGEEGERERKKPIINHSFTSSSILSSMLPAPKNSLCLAPVSKSNSISSRKSALDTQLPAISTEQVELAQETSEFESNWINPPAQIGTEPITGYNSIEGSSSEWAPDYGNSMLYSNYGGNWDQGSVVTRNEELHIQQDLGRAMGKRGRNQIPTEIVEVKQEELVKNRPREDQVKLTGLAFGPSYQPVPSAKGKPSKLHKRKHQIGSLYYDMKQKEMELAERRAKGFLTKAETQGKYGW